MPTKWKELELCKHWVLTILSEGLTPDGLYDIYEIRDGNDEVLLNHMTAMYNILGEGIKKLNPVVEKQKEGNNEKN